MSLIGAVLAFVVFPLKARAPLKSEREKKLEAEVERLTFALDYWRNAADALHRDVERITAVNDSLRHSQQSILLRQDALFAQQRQFAQRQNAAQNWQGLGQLAQNAFTQQFDGFCNCVPSRSQIILNQGD